MPSLIYRIAILHCRGCISVLAEISDLAIKTEIKPSVAQAIHKAIHALNNVINEIEKAA